ncbi:hypothetical protein [Elizabethkingia ursingii]|jgi:hypothetical protein|uniref:Uncharacterized protein n=1 Tax=Elizabethkingia ursingii TaxID=1756150 RepID=A0AAJ3TP61_9FLAO|nr:hypothetical protein [Elizabethkingia ursingii]AQX09969.1 hypothetical protein BBD34_15635 [Elizabethkingia ursingii]OPB76113.1 hypothetical protein BAY32_05005 [Elizabethkingia ursingii]OPC06187.1 hypothetical protein BAS09_00925 [Elizabethkingia ursingii]
MENQENQNSIEKLHREIKKIKNQNKILSFSLFIIVISFFAYSFSTNPEAKFSSIRVKNIIVEDDMGKDRIIIASDFSKTKSRIRKDSLGGVLVLDENGHDQVLLGHSRTAQFNGKKIIRTQNEKPYGLYINDENGDERGGITYYNKRKIAVLGLDNSTGEGVHLLASEKGFNNFSTGILVQKTGGNGSLFAGETTDGKMMLSLNANKNTTNFYADKSSSAIEYKDLKTDSIKQILKIYK